jgi:DNA adenine methylase
MSTLQNQRTEMLSPFRYPGGKAFLFDRLKLELARFEHTDREYAEPFAGGAGAAIRLLSAELVERIRINDADVRVYAAWHAMLRENDRFLSRIAESEVSIDEWYRYAELVKHPHQAPDLFELGFATFFLNRTNRSGIVLGAAPIGGYHQTGKWKLDARFNKATLAERISWIGKKQDRIVLTNLDGFEFLKRVSKRRYSERTLFLVDPPYVGAGGRLYLDLMNEKKHRALAQFLQSGSLRYWIVTYDDCSLISDIYSVSDINSLNVVYSLQRKRKQNELLITPNLKEWKRNRPSDSQRL